MKLKKPNVLRPLIKELRPLIKEIIKELTPAIKEIARAAAKAYVEQEMKKLEKR